jgi:4-hydroxybenzoate polyprenyltransferase
MNLTKKIFAYIKITRPINVIITFLVVIVAILISEKVRTEIGLITMAHNLKKFSLAVA